METSVTSKGTRIIHNGGITAKVVDRAMTKSATERRSSATSSDPTVNFSIAAILSGLADDGLTLHESFDIVPNATKKSSVPSSRRIAPHSPKSSESGAITIAIDLAANEQAALLVERDGVFEWQLPTQDREPPALRRGGPSSGNTAVFVIGWDRHAGQPGSTRRGGLLDTVIDAVTDTLRTYVFKFVAHKALGSAARVVECNLKPGLIVIGSKAPAEWVTTSTPPKITYKPGQPARLLLFIHGTFSSTQGSFGALGLTQEGKKFIEAAEAHYDALLAFDHSTLLETPEQNAKSIVDALGKLALPAGSTVDIIAYSRGGLVARLLTERLLTAGTIVKPDRTVFVGCTNGGTALARPENWKALLDIYTNLAVAAGRGLALFDAGVANTVIQGTVKTLGGFVQAVVDAAITEAAVPGIAAMSPSGDLVSSLNSSANAPASDSQSYFVIGSNFESSVLKRPGNTSSLPVKLLRALADFNVDALMGADNDLVVDNKAMQEFGLHGAIVDGLLMWRDNTVIYHTNYFAQAETAKALGAWLTEPEGKRKRRAVVKTPPILSFDLPKDTLLTQSKALNAEQIVIINRQPHGLYVREAGQIVAAIQSSATQLELADQLELHEWMVAETVFQDQPAPSPISQRGWIRVDHGVVTEAFKPLLMPSGLVLETPSPNTDRTLGGPNERLVATGRSEKLSADRDRSYEADRSRGGVRTRSKSDDSRLPPAHIPVTPNVNDQTVPPPMRLPDGQEQEVPLDVICNFGAEMMESPPLEEPAELTITVSREELNRVISTTVVVAKATANPEWPILLEIQAKANCKVVGTASEEIRVPEPGKPEIYDFKVQGLHSGKAEVWVDARQGARRLARMVLQPVFVATGTLKASATISESEVDPPSVQLRIYEITEGNNSNFSLRFVLESRDLNISLEHETQRFNMPRDAYVTSLYDRLEGEWGSNSGDFENFMRGIRSFGGDMYEHIVPEKIRKAIWDNRYYIGSIEVISHEPFIPWEILHVVEPGKKMPLQGNMFLAELGLVRWTRNCGWPTSNLKVANSRARHVVPEYPSSSHVLPFAAIERKLLEDLFNSKSIKADSHDVLKELSAGGSFDLLHFACHGSANDKRIWDASLMMEGRINPSNGNYVQDVLGVIDVSQFADLGSKTNAAPIIFLNACQAGKAGQTLTGTGGMGEAFIKAGAGLFVGTLWSVGDKTALVFAETFYRTLLNGKTLNQAMRAAREQAKKAKEPTWLAYTVYGHPYARLSYGDV